MGPGLADGVAEGKAAEHHVAHARRCAGMGSLPYVQGGDCERALPARRRARTLTEAILWHCGRGRRPAVTRFENLPKTDRDALMAFPASLL